MLIDLRCQVSLLVSGLMFYIYNELSTMTIKATGAITGSVANTAKRIFVLWYMSTLVKKLSLIHI